MTTHKYPAVLPPQRQQAIEDATARIHHELTQAFVSAAAWEARALQAEEGLQDERGAHEATKRELEMFAKAIFRAAREGGALEGKTECLRSALARAIHAAQAQSDRADVAERRLNEALMREGAGDA